MGLFGIGGDTPTLTIPEAPDFISADEAFQGALGFGQQVTPLALQAREGALTDLSRGTEFFEGFQPTSFEEALQNQFFQNVFPDVERSIKQNLSLAGIESSPVLAEQISRARGELGVDIGQILANLGNQRGQFNLQSRLNIDPFRQILNPFADRQIAQDKLQKEADFQRALLQAQADFGGDISNFNQRGSTISNIGSILGGAGGFFLGGPAGAAIGAGIGGSAAQLFGGGAAPIDLATALQASQGLPGRTRGGTIGNTGKTQSQILGFNTKQFSGAPELVFQ